MAATWPLNGRCGVALTPEKNGIGTAEWFEYEKKVCRDIAQAGYAANLQNFDYLRRFVSEFGMPWWIPKDHPIYEELHSLCPIRLRGSDPSSFAYWYKSTQEN